MVYVPASTFIQLLPGSRPAGVRRPSHQIQGHRKTALGHAFQIPWLGHYNVLPPTPLPSSTGTTNGEKVLLVEPSRLTWLFQLTGCATRSSHGEAAWEVGSVTPCPTLSASSPHSLRAEGPQSSSPRGQHQEAAISRVSACPFCRGSPSGLQTRPPTTVPRTLVTHRCQERVQQGPDGFQN